MDNTLQRLLKLVEEGRVEQRCAALLVLGALKVDTSQAVKVVSSFLDQANPVLKDYALRYFEETQSKLSLAAITRLLDDADKEFQDRAVQLLTRFGPTAVQPVLQFSSGATRGAQLNAARVLSAVRNKTALKGLLQMLMGGSDEFNKAVCDLTVPAIRDMEDKEREQLYQEVEAFAAKLDVARQRPAVVSVMRMIGQLGRPEARRWLFKFVTPENHHTLRTHALVALLRCLRELPLHRDEYNKLFSLLEENDFSEIGRLALDLLDAHEMPDDSRSLLSRLLASPHAEVQKFALRKMSAFNTPATVRTLIEQLGDPDYRKRDIAARSLRKIPEARNALIKDLTACNDASKAWSIAELLPTFEGKWRQDTLDALWKRLQGAIADEDRIQTAFLHVLKDAEPKYCYAQLAAQGTKLTKSKKFREAAAFLNPLKEFSEFKPEDKFNLAVAHFKLHSHTVTTNRQHPAVELLAELYRNSAYPLMEQLRKQRSLETEDLFNLGFALAERQGNERTLGKDLLEHVAAKFPRNKIGKSAKNKLRLMTRA